jgi:hypothetical protein
VFDRAPFKCTLCAIIFCEVHASAAQQILSPFPLLGAARAIAGIRVMHFLNVEYVPT